jgi:hypothetical protein
MCVPVNRGMECFTFHQTLHCYSVCRNLMCCLKLCEANALQPSVGTVVLQCCLAVNVLQCSLESVVLQRLVESAVLHLCLEANVLQC